LEHCAPQLELCKTCEPVESDVALVAAIAKREDLPAELRAQ
jgi:hypothetical protein